jgi:hypothetical protein
VLAGLRIAHQHGRLTKLNLHLDGRQARYWDPNELGSMRRKSGSVRRNLWEDAMEGRTRSGRRVSRGPSPSFGAATSVRRVVCEICCRIGCARGRSERLIITVSVGCGEWCRCYGVS